MNALDNLADSLEFGTNEVFVDPAIGARAMIPLKRMLDFSAERKCKLQGNA